MNVRLKEAQNYLKGRFDPLNKVEKHQLDLQKLQ